MLEYLFTIGAIAALTLVQINHSAVVACLGTSKSFILKSFFIKESYYKYLLLNSNEVSLLRSIDNVSRSRRSVPTTLPSWI